MNKRGRAGSKLMIGFFIFVLVIIGGGITAMIFIFYGDGYDFRSADSEVLNFKIEKCLLEKEIDWNIDGDFYSKCGFNREVMERNYVYGILEGEKVLLKIGDYKSCEITIEKKGDYPQCKIGAVGNLKIITGSNQRAGRATG